MSLIQLAPRCAFVICLLVAVFCVTLSRGATGADTVTYYVAPAGQSGLSADPSSPGSLGAAVASAPSGSTVVLMDGTYDAPPNGYVIASAGVIFRARDWHAAIVTNTVKGDLWSPASQSVTGDVCQGIVFGPSTGEGWSGGGGPGWKFLDCVFYDNGGVGAGSHSLFEHCLFTDAKSNSFDIGGGQSDRNTGVEFKNCIARRGNRASADDDGVGSKEDFTKGIVYDGLVSYDNNGNSLWFDTDNDDWTIKNCTFFGNHGGNNWYYCSIAGAKSTTKLIANGQDGQGIAVGMPLRAIAGTQANIGHDTVVTAISGSGPQILTVSPALPAVAQNGDMFIAQQDNASSGDGFTTEANDNGTFDNNWTYSNTDVGFYDHASGGSTYGSSGGLIVTNNLFAYDGQGFQYQPDGRDDGPALVEFNQFKFKPGRSSAFGSAGGSLGDYPGPMHILFDYNTYDADATGGSWASWECGSPALVAGGLSDGSAPSGQDYLQNPSTWRQDLHSTVSNIAFWGVPPAVYVWPPAADTNWSDDFHPNNTFGLSNSIHQINDTDGAVNNTIDAAVAGHKPGDIIEMPVSAHMPISGTTCEVYDLNGRWVTLAVNPQDQGQLLKSIPPYVACAAGNKTVTYKIRVILTSVEPYDVRATYTQDSGTAPAAPKLLMAKPGSGQCTLVWSASSGATSYDVYRDDVKAASGLACTSYTDDSASNGGSYRYSIESVNSYGVSPKSNELGASPHPVSASLSGESRSVSEEAKTTTYDLTALGPVDWRQWGDIGGAHVKASGGTQIGDLQPFGGGKYGRWGGPGRNVSWSDGAPIALNTDDQNFLWCNTVQNAGWTFTVPADTTDRTLTMVWGGSDGAMIQLKAHLSDGSAPDYVDSKTVPGSSGSGTYLETIRFNSASTGQTLTITLTHRDATGASIDILGASLK